jgi:hypothetical protein
MSTRDESEARRHILARRALFVAAALAGCRDAEKRDVAGVDTVRTAASSNAADAALSSDASTGADASASPWGDAGRLPRDFSPMPGVCLSIRRPPGDDEPADAPTKLGDGGLDAPKAAPAASAPASSQKSAKPKP